MVGKSAMLLLFAVVCCQGFESQATDIDIPPSLKTGEEGKPVFDEIQQDNHTYHVTKLRVFTERFSRIDPKGLELANLINRYRSQYGLPAVPISKSLTLVANWHVRDSHFKRESPCNLHSWTVNGPWTACCYTPDHAQARCIWQKPREIAQFPGNGYEISVWSTSLTPNQALSLWQKSPGHNAVILNQGIWASRKWQAMGVGIDGNYAHVWFSDVADKTS